MMESDRVRVLAEYEDRENSKRLERLKGAQVLQQQIEDNVQTDLLEKERKDQETRVSKIICRIEQHYVTLYIVNK